jgi:hypothetical protein
LVLRTLQAIVAAIQLAAPGVPDPDAFRFARALREQAQVHDFDPFTAVAVIHSESRFNPLAISPDGEDYGLGQIRARYIGACKQADSPVDYPTDGCIAQKQRLLDPEENIRILAEMISRHRDLCQRKVRSVKFQHWLASYQGRNDPQQRRWCKPAPETWKVVKYRNFLIQELYKRRILKSPV